MTANSDSSLPRTNKAKDENFADMHFVVVDDDRAFLTVVEALLRSIGAARITVATSGADAYNKLLSINVPVDCIICDYTMDNGNGLQLLQTIRMGKVKYFRADACFILLTASADSETVSMAAQLDVNAYLVKPVTQEKLRATIVRARARYFRLNMPAYVKVVIPDA